MDTGSEVSLVPFSAVQGLELHTSNRCLMATNGSDIRVVGEIRIPIKIRAGFELSTALLVFDQITEPILWMDWLREHRTLISFGTGALCIGRKRICLVRGSGSTWLW